MLDVDEEPFVMIDDLVVDVFLHEQHQFASDVTEYPVESGSDIADNIRPKPIKVTVTGLVSNAPIGPVATLRQADFIQGASDGDYASDAYKKLLAVRDARKEIEIRTSLQTFKSMVMEDLTVTRGPGSNQMLEFTATFVQITTVENKHSIRVAIPAAQAKTKKDNGLKTSTLKPIQIDTYDGTWFDEAIMGWREGAQWSATPTEEAPGGHWQCRKGRPLGEDPGRWTRGEGKTDAEYLAQNTKSYVNVPNVDKKTGKLTGPFTMKPGYTLTTDATTINNAIDAGATDRFGNRLDGQ